MNRVEEFIIDAASLGKENPLPDMRTKMYVRDGKFVLNPEMVAEGGYHFGEGVVANMLPYKAQDGYDRNKKPTKIRSVVLENERLKAVFLPDYGGKLWSLYDKKEQRDLLYTNSVIQPCNLAIRNAWLSGGVEFNVGILGHGPFTCSTMFTELIGDNAVRFYEYERIRGVAYGFTAYLPDGSDTLYIRPRIENTKSTATYTYWWSNIAFPETPNTRTITPSHAAVTCAYKENYYDVHKESVPMVNGVDVSYAYRGSRAADWFFDIPKNTDKWVMAVDPNGDGLLQYSTRQLIGRKLFLWGNTPGGRHWNEFLSEKGQAYLEIQAGLLHTQLEHVELPANTVWEWTEAYTYVNGANEKFYGDWDAAIDECWKQIENKFQGGAADFSALEKLDMSGEVKPLYQGSSWGALENELRNAHGEKPVSQIYSFPYTQDETVQEYVQLLHKGYLPCRSVEEEPLAYANGEYFNELLKKSLSVPQGDHWYTYLQLGVNEYTLGHKEKAEQAFKKSIEKQPSIWAYRNLGMLYFHAYQDNEKAFTYMQKAYQTTLGDTCRAFVVEYEKFLLDIQKPQVCVDVYERLNDTLKKDTRITVYYATALVEVDREEEAIAIIRPDMEVPDVKEGETSLSNLWISAYAKRIAKRDGVSVEQAKEYVEDEYPVPYGIDFRMSGVKIKKDKGDNEYV
ncbi:MAG: DUF5107 domain-containing protein [Clostridia bacterium]|nr:DUF5107 domain-containing protein [Clostridia bacterium]